MPSRLVRWIFFFPALAAAPLAAQQGSITDKIGDLFKFGTCGEPLCLDGSINAQNGHGEHFIPSAVAGNLQVINFLTDAVASTTSNFPIGSTSGGATYQLVGGVPVKTSNSLGPIFAERADNLGKGRFLMGAAVNFIQYQSMRGVPINNLLFNFTHQNVGDSALGNPLRENDFITVQVDLAVSQVVTAYYMTYGLLSRLDLSVAVPVVHSSMTGSSTAQIFTFGTPAVHFFSGDSANPVLRASATTFGSASGLGDIDGRMKIGITAAQKFSSSLMIDVRFPTGDPDNLLGSGTYSGRALAIFSSHFGNFNPHANVGYLFREGDLNDEIVANAGFDAVIASFATMAIDVLSNWVLGTPFQVPPPVNYTSPYQRTVIPTTVPNGYDHRIDASAGFKFKISKPGTLIVNALLPMRDGGVEPSVVWSGGFEFNF
jgi:hypothetical protein